MRLHSQQISLFSNFELDTWKIASAITETFPNQTIRLKKKKRKKERNLQFKTNPNTLQTRSARRDRKQFQI